MSQAEQEAYVAESLNRALDEMRKLVLSISKKDLVKVVKEEVRETKRIVIIIIKL